MASGIDGRHLIVEISPELGLITEGIYNINHVMFQAPIVISSNAGDSSQTKVAYLWDEISGQFVYNAGFVCTAVGRNQ